MLSLHYTTCTFAAAQELPNAVVSFSSAKAGSRCLLFEEHVHPSLDPRLVIGHICAHLFFIHEAAEIRDIVDKGVQIIDAIRDIRHLWVQLLQLLLEFLAHTCTEYEKWNTCTCACTGVIITVSKRSNVPGGGDTRIICCWAGRGTVFLSHIYRREYAPFIARETASAEVVTMRWRSQYQSKYKIIQLSTLRSTSASILSFSLSLSLSLCHHHFSPSPTSTQQAHHPAHHTLFPQTYTSLRVHIFPMLYTRTCLIIHVRPCRFPACLHQHDSVLAVCRHSLKIQQQACAAVLLPWSAFGLRGKLL